MKRAPKYSKQRAAGFRAEIQPCQSIVRPAHTRCRCRLNVPGIIECLISSKQFSITYYIWYVNKKIPQYMQLASVPGSISVLYLNFIIFYPQISPQRNRLRISQGRQITQIKSRIPIRQPTLCSFSSLIDSMYSGLLDWDPDSDSDESGTGSSFVSPQI